MLEADPCRAVTRGGRYFPLGFSDLSKVWRGRQPSPRHNRSRSRSEPALHVDLWRGFKDAGSFKTFLESLSTTFDMVLDPFSALGLASNVVQFVDFGTKLFAGAAELYHSVDGTLAVNAQLETITKDLSSMSAELGTANHYGTQPVSADVKNLMELALSCKQLADEVLVVLTKLKVPNGHGRWKSIRQALAGAWKEKEIRAYVERLDRFRSQMTAHLIAILGLIFPQTYDYDL